MSTPISRAAVDNSASNHLLSEQIDQQHGHVAFWTVTTQAYGSAKKLALWAATLADTALPTTRALVDRPRHHSAPPLELLAQLLQIR